MLCVAPSTSLSAQPKVCGTRADEQTYEAVGRVVLPRRIWGKKKPSWRKSKDRPSASTSYLLPTMSEMSFCIPNLSCIILDIYLGVFEKLVKKWIGLNYLVIDFLSSLN